MKHDRDRIYQKKLGPVWFEKWANERLVIWALSFNGPSEKLTVSYSRPVEWFLVA